jgi:hypothetical protein
MIGRFGHGVMQHIIQLLSHEERDDTLHGRSLLVQKAGALESINKCGTLRYLSILCYNGISTNTHLHLTKQILKFVVFALLSDSPHQTDVQIGSIYFIVRCLS